MKIALVTYFDQGKYDSDTVETEDDKLLLFLQNKGLQIELAIWNDPKVDWKSFQLVILKSPWDYFDLINEFHEWLNNLETNNIKLLNSIDTVRWNTNKHYLKEIEEAGLSITPSIFVNKGNHVDLNSYFDHFKTDRLIVKPCVSGGAKNTFKVSVTNVEEVNASLNLLLEDEDFIIQPFLPEILEQGEWSFIFFNGIYSHSLVKLAKAGDFRVQPAHGGSVHPQNPSTELVETAKEYVKRFAADSLYTRVDGTFVNGRFLLMELELIEPFLFLNTDPKNYERYYDALVAQM